jgi:hypothetical protein
MRGPLGRCTATRGRHVLLRDLLRRVRSALSPVPANERPRFRRIEDWIAGLTLEEARSLAWRVVDNPEWFRTQLGDGSKLLPSDAPPIVRELYHRYLSVTGRFCDMRLVASDCRASEAQPDLLRVGWDDAHVELCIRGREDRVFLVATDVARGEAIEGSVPSLYHAIVRMAAVLEYVPVPAAA